MKYLALLLLIATNAYADYERVVTGQSYQIKVNGVLIGKPSPNRNLMLGTGYNEAKKCYPCKVIMISADATISARLVIASSSAASSSAAQVVQADPPTMRENGVPLPISEHGGYEIRINDQRIDIPRTSGAPLSHKLTSPILKTDIITIAFYDSDKLYSDFVVVPTIAN